MILTLYTSGISTDGFQIVGSRFDLLDSLLRMEIIFHPVRRISFSRPPFTPLARRIKYCLRPLPFV